jgi:transposase
VADVARRHGLNANLIFTWKRRIGARAAAIAPAPESAPPSSSSSAEFLPVGIVARERAGAPANLDHEEATEIAFARQASAAPLGMDGRSGVIEIDMADGVRLRVDAFVDARALRRVLAALRSA